MIRLVLILIAEVGLWFAVFFQQLLQEPPKLDVVEKYGPLSIAALAIMVMFYVVKMQNDNAKARDKQIAERDEAQTEAMNTMSRSMVEIKTIISERLPR